MSKTSMLWAETLPHGMHVIGHMTVLRCSNLRGLPDGLQVQALTISSDLTVDENLYLYGKLKAVPSDVKIIT
jgi:hypothetical protein